MYNLSCMLVNGIVLEKKKISSSDKIVVAFV